MYITDEQAETWKRAFELTGADLEIVAEVIQKFNEAVRILAEEAVKALGVLWGDIEEALREAEESALYRYEPIGRKKKRERDRRRAMKLAETARFSGYCTGRLCWAVKRRTRPRARERGPPTL